MYGAQKRHSKPRKGRKMAMPDLWDSGRRYCFCGGGGPERGGYLVVSPWYRIPGTPGLAWDVQKVDSHAGAHARNRFVPPGIVRPDRLARSGGVLRGNEIGLFPNSFASESCPGWLGALLRLRRLSSRGQCCSGCGPCRCNFGYPHAHEASSLSERGGGPHRRSCC